MTTFTVVSGLYYGFGGLLGNMLGGFVYHSFGGEVLFEAMGVASGVWVLVMIFYFHGFKWCSRKRDNVTKVVPVDAES